MVRKVITMCIAAAILLSVLCTPIVAATHNVYAEGNISTTYVQYFKDILSGEKINSDYIAFRSGQYSYTMVVGDLDYTNGVVSLKESGTIYTFTQSGNYNSTYSYNCDTINNFSVSVGDNIVYSNVGHFPHLIERSAHIETFTLVLLGAMCVFYVVDRIFRHC